MSAEINKETIVPLTKAINDPNSDLDTLIKIIRTYNAWSEEQGMKFLAEFLNLLNKKTD